MTAETSHQLLDADVSELNLDDVDIEASDHGLHSEGPEEVTPLPTKQVIVLSLMNLNESFTMNVLWPMLPFFVEDSGISGGDPKNNGYYVGILASSFFFASFLTSSAWGRMADKHGRKKALLTGLLGSALSNFMFAFAKNYYYAIVARVLCGLLNGNIGVTKSYLGEITDKTNQSKGFSYLGFAWGLGAIVAPVVGGFLNRPAEQYPDTFPKDSFWTEYAYFLPSLISGLVGLTTFGLALTMLPESPKWLVLHKRRQTLLLRSASTNAVVAYKALVEADANTAVASRDSKEEEGLEMSILPDHNDSAHHDSPSSRSPGSGSGSILLHTGKGKTHNGYSQVLLGDDESQTPGTDDISTENDSPLVPGGKQEQQQEEEDIAESRTNKELLRDGTVMKAVACYGLTAMVYVLFDEILPLFSKTSTENDGLGLSSQSIGIILTVQGIMLVVFQLFIYQPLYAKARGPVDAFQKAILGTGLSILLFPLLAPEYRLTHSNVVLWGTVIVLICFKACVACTQFTCVMILVNNSGTSVDLGAINGIGQSASSLARAIGPLLGGSLWSASLRIDFALHYYIPYLLQILVIAVAYYISKRLPASINDPKA